MTKYEIVSEELKKLLDAGLISLEIYGAIIDRAESEGNDEKQKEPTDTEKMIEAFMNDVAKVE